MSRFEKFQNKQVCNEKGEPLYKQIHFHDCIINFENGLISNWDNEEGNEKDCPAISCIDGHIEFWEEGVLNKENGPAVNSSALELFEFWKNGQLEGVGYYNEELDEIEEFLQEKGHDAEFAFAKYLNQRGIPFIHLEQFTGTLYSAALRKKKIKRPDYLIFINSRPFFIEVKATGCYSIKKEELNKLNALKNEFSINVVFAITDIKNEKFEDFNFMTLDNLNNYVNTIKNTKDISKWLFYPYPKSLLKNKLIHDTINDDELKKIYSSEELYNEYDYNAILSKYLKDNNYIVK